MADHIGSEHHEVLFTADDISQMIKELIYHVESFDITVIRASVGKDVFIILVKVHISIQL